MNYEKAPSLLKSTLIMSMLNCTGKLGTSHLTQQEIKHINNGFLPIEMTPGSLNKTMLYNLGCPQAYINMPSCKKSFSGDRITT